MAKPPHDRGSIGQIAPTKLHSVGNKTSTQKNIVGVTVELRDAIPGQIVLAHIDLSKYDFSKKIKKSNNIGKLTLDKRHKSYDPEVEFPRLRYNDRPNKKENAKDFLERVYAHELKEKSISLSTLRMIDRPLWAGLRNWANHGAHELDTVIPRGRITPGPPRKDGQDIDESKLDPNDPVQALALDSLRQRRRARERAAESYARRKNLQPK